MRPDVFYERSSFPSSRLAGKVVGPKELWTDIEHTFFIEETITTLDKIMELCEGDDPAYDLETVEKLVQDYGSDSVERERLEKLNLLEGSNPYRKKVHLYEYWGPLLNKDGKLLQRNVRLVVANKQHIINKHNIANPFWHQQPPYVAITPINYIFRQEGRSLIEGTISLQKALNDMTNMTLDGLLFKLAKMFEMDPDRLRSPEEFKGLEPGMALAKKGDNPVVTEVPVSDVPAGVLRETEFVRRAIQNDHGVTDFLMASNPMKSGTTATEVSTKSSESNAMFEGISRSVEVGVERCVEMIQALTLQYWTDFDDEALKSIAQRYGLPFTAPSREMRISFFRPGLRAVVKGVSTYFRKLEDLRKYLEFLAQIGRIKPLVMRLQLRETMKRVVECYSFDDPDNMLVDVQYDMMVTQAERQQYLMSLMPPPMMMPGGGAPPSAPGGGRTGPPPGAPQSPQGPERPQTAGAGSGPAPRPPMRVVR